MFSFKLSAKLALMVASLLAMPLFASASPITVCYQATKRVPKAVPSILCLDGIYESALQNVLQIESHDGSMPESIKITRLSRHNEDRYFFAAEALLVNDWQYTCSYGLKAYLKIEGESETGFIRADHLNVSVGVMESNDVCHFEPPYEMIPYAKISGRR
ncbi:MAG: hypothetical protein ACJ763_16520 [Bdellovibrionia bacterium]